MALNSRRWKGWTDKESAVSEHLMAGDDKVMGTSSDTQIWRLSGGAIQLQATTENWRTLHIQQVTGRCCYSRGYLVRSWHLTGMPLMIEVVPCEPVLSGDTQG
jgi:hypothetical protein